MSEQELLQKIEALEQKLIQSSLEHQERTDLLFDLLAWLVSESLRCHTLKMRDFCRYLNQLEDRCPDNKSDLDYLYDLVSHKHREQNG